MNPRIVQEPQIISCPRRVSPPRGHPKRWLVGFLRIAQDAVHGAVRVTKNHDAPRARWQVSLPDRKRGRKTRVLETERLLSSVSIEQPMDRHRRNQFRR